MSYIVVDDSRRNTILPVYDHGAVRRLGYGATGRNRSRGVARGPVYGNRGGMAQGSPMTIFVQWTPEFIKAYQQFINSGMRAAVVQPASGFPNYGRRMQGVSTGPGLQIR
ncbi:hypothetical protein I4U23_004745 [Adineta vaga]|nr:hypothetical protein I4U23_004745 [Adineta vaga]